MTLKKLSVITVLIFNSNLIFAGTSGKKHKKTTEEVSYIEANVIAGSGNCGYLLQLANGLILQPSSAIPKKFRDNHLKVLIKYEDLNKPAADDNTCNAAKLITVTEIKKYKNTTHIKAKY